MKEKLVLAGLTSLMLGLLVYTYLTSFEKFVLMLAMGIGYAALGLFYFAFVRQVAQDMLRLQEEKCSQEEGHLSASKRHSTSPN